MTTLDQNRLVTKVDSLGQIRQLVEDDSFIGIRNLAPFREVSSDDVIFQYVMPEVSGLAPARAEDAEAEMTKYDDSIGHGRASLIDWSLKDRYAASDVTRYREFLRMALQAGSGTFSLSATSMTEDFQAKLAGDARRRKEMLDNRLEWLAVTGAFTNAISYNDGNIVFSTSFGRPAAQTAAAPPGGTWNLTTSDPIGDIEAMNEFMFLTYGVRMKEAYTSEKVLRNILNSDRFAARSGLAGATGSVPIDPKYLIDGWGWAAAQRVVEAATGVKILPYDAVYRTRAIGSKTMVVNRFSDERDILFMPPRAVIDGISDLGFGATLTSPHPEGNFTHGFYEWETETKDPWQTVRGTGIKGFPVYPHLEMSYVMRVLP